MAYAPGNLCVVSASLSGRDARHWAYWTAADSDAAITGAGYFSDGATKGMRVGDLVDVVATTGPKFKRYQVAAQDGVGATVAAPTAIT